MDPNSLNSNRTNHSSYPPDSNEKRKLKKLLLIAVSILVIISFILVSVRSQNQQDKYIKSATAAARMVTPNATVSNLKVADGFAIAKISYSTTESQTNIVNTAVFKVNQDGSMKQLASGSYFGSLDLLQLGIPLTTQVKLTGSSIKQIQQNLADQCGYSGGNAPGYNGFDGSFNPGGWQIDAATRDGLEQTLTAIISNQNAKAKNGEKVICVNAPKENSNFSTDKRTYISTFKLELQFITGNGIVINHIFTFATGPDYYRSYTLDGQKIQTL